MTSIGCTEDTIRGPSHSTTLRAGSPLRFAQDDNKKRQLIEMIHRAGLNVGPIRLALRAGYWTFRAKDDFLHSPAHNGPGSETSFLAPGTRLRIRGPALHRFLRSKKQAQRRRLRKGPQGPFAGEGDRGICPVRAGT